VLLVAAADTCTTVLCCVLVNSFHTNRAFYSLRKVGIEADDVRMAVCVMRVVPARYAFVIHTKNPSNNDANEVGVWRGGGRLC
jgi:phosphoenolpyruvate synthase/pyruvate phosphate dikinase